MEKESDTAVIHRTSWHGAVYQKKATFAQRRDCRFYILNRVTHVIRGNPDSGQRAQNRRLIIERLQQLQSRFTRLVKKSHSHVLERIIDRWRGDVTQVQIEGLGLLDVTASDADVVKQELRGHCQYSITGETLQSRVVMIAEPQLSPAPNALNKTV